jgi:putative ubiquitin-RnfH superfamily antitoxin RatB of RatAB toxin-antitoxin module
MKVIVVYVAPQFEFRCELELEPGSSVNQALRSCGVLERFPELAQAPLGIFEDGDRLEIYRPLAMEPKQSRLARVRKRGS